MCQQRSITVSAHQPSHDSEGCLSLAAWVCRENDWLGLPAMMQRAGVCTPTSLFYDRFALFCFFLLLSIIFFRHLRNQLFYPQQSNQLQSLQQVSNGYWFLYLVFYYSNTLQRRHHQVINSSRQPVESLNRTFQNFSHSF